MARVLVEYGEGRKIAKLLACIVGGLLIARKR